MKIAQNIILILAKMNVMFKKKKLDEGNAPH